MVRLTKAFPPAEGVLGLWAAIGSGAGVARIRRRFRAWRRPKLVAGWLIGEIGGG